MKNVTRCKIGCGIATIIIFTLGFFGGIMIQRFFRIAYIYSNNFNLIIDFANTTA